MLRKCGYSDDSDDGVGVDGGGDGDNGGGDGIDGGGDGYNTILKFRGD